MTLKKYLDISIKNIVCNKKNTLKIFFITFFSFVLFILTISLANSLNYFIENSILNTADHRTIMIDYNIDINIDNKINNLLENNTSIIEFNEYREPIAGKIKDSKSLFENNDSNNLTLTSGFKKSMPQIIKGNIFDSNDKNVGIIPEKFDPSGINQVEFKKEHIQYLNGEDFLGKTLTVEFKNPEDNSLSFEYSFKVIGTYDSLKNKDFPSDVYIPYNDMEIIHEKYNEIMSKYYSNDDSFKTIVALVDRHETVQNIVNKLRDNNIDAFPKSTVGLLEHLYKIIINIGTIISVTIFIVSTINISLNNVRNLRKRQSEFGMLKAFGYKDSQLRNIIIWESTIINTTSLFVGIIISQIILSMLNVIVKNCLSMYMSELNFTINYTSILVGIVVMAFVIILSNLKSISYIINLQPINSIKNKN